MRTLLQLSLEMKTFLIKRNYWGQGGRSIDIIDKSNVKPTKVISEKIYLIGLVIIFLING